MIICAMSNADHIWHQNFINLTWWPPRCHLCHQATQAHPCCPWRWLLISCPPACTPAKFYVPLPFHSWSHLNRLNSCLYPCSTGFPDQQADLLLVRWQDPISPHLLPEVMFLAAQLQILTALEELSCKFPSEHDSRMTIACAQDKVPGSSAASTLWVMFISSLWDQISIWWADAELKTGKPSLVLLCSFGSDNAMHQDQMCMCVCQRRWVLRNNQWSDSARSRGSGEWGMKVLFH